MRKKFSWGWPLRTIAAIALAVRGGAGGPPTRSELPRTTGPFSVIDINLAKVILEDHMGIRRRADFHGHLHRPVARPGGGRSGRGDGTLSLVQLRRSREPIDRKGMVEVLGDLGVVAPWLVRRPTSSRVTPSVASSPWRPDLSSYKDLEPSSCSRPETGDKGFFLDGVQWAGKPTTKRASNLGGDRLRRHRARWWPSSNRPTPRVSVVLGSGRPTGCRRPMT